MKEKQRKSQIEFIDQANSVYDNFYNYDKVVYVNDKTNVIITCPVHADFPQRPGVHLKNGCKKCGMQRAADIRRKSEEEQFERMYIYTWRCL